MASRLFRKIIFQEATEGLKLASFKEISEGIYSLPVHEDVWGFLVF